MDYGRNSHDEIFLDRSDQLQGLDCHLIYTIPISMVYFQPGQRPERNLRQPRPAAHGDGANPPMEPCIRRGWPKCRKY